MVALSVHMDACIYFFFPEKNPHIEHSVCGGKKNFSSENQHLKW